MKRILALSLCLGLALTQVGQAKDNNKKVKRTANKQAAAAQHNANVAHKQSVKVQRNVQAHRSVQAHRNVSVHHANANYHAKVNARNNAAAVNAARARQQNNAVVAKQNQRIANHNNRIANQNYRNAVQNNRTVTRNNVVIRNRNSWYEARNNFNWHQHHDRSWWHYHYPSTRFVIFGGGYYFWNNGYWYPAYGYDPAYSRYTFDEPIYGPNESDPGRVISDVQIQLQRDGYYAGPIDGLIGPMTRRALARYQADNGLYVTRAIDEPTLQALGLA
jgi:hypothetical protein